MRRQRWNAGNDYWNELRLANKTMTVPQHASGGVSRKQREEDRNFEREKMLATLGFQRDQLSSHERIAGVNANAKTGAAESGANSRENVASINAGQRERTGDLTSGRRLEGAKYGADQRYAGVRDSNDARENIADVLAANKIDVANLNNDQKQAIADIVDYHKTQSEDIQRELNAGKMKHFDAQDAQRRLDFGLKEKLAQITQQRADQQGQHFQNRDEIGRRNAETNRAMVGNSAVTKINDLGDDKKGLGKQIQQPPRIEWQEPQEPPKSKYQLLLQGDAQPSSRLKPAPQMRDIGGNTPPEPEQGPYPEQRIELPPNENPDNLPIDNGAAVKALPPAPLPWLPKAATAQPDTPDVMPENALREKAKKLKAIHPEMSDEQAMDLISEQMGG